MTTRPVPDVDAPHAWCGGSLLELTERQARLALLRGFVPLPQRTKVKVLEIYCLTCRRPYEDVADEPCSALANNEHLRGGPIGVRAKRRRHDVDDDAIVVLPLPATGTG